MLVTVRTDLELRLLMSIPWPLIILKIEHNGNTLSLDFSSTCTENVKRDEEGVKDSTNVCHPDTTVSSTSRPSSADAIPWCLTCEDFGLWHYSNKHCLASHCIKCCPICINCSLVILEGGFPHLWPLLKDFFQLSLTTDTNLYSAIDGPFIQIITKSHKHVFFLFESILNEPTISSFRSKAPPPRYTHARLPRLHPNLRQIMKRTMSRTALLFQ